jgi:carbamoyl-phosphate synthase small subunit
VTSAGEGFLVLADGTAYRGEAFGADREGEGEVVFHTGMTGYQEILTDPSYAGQIVCMTYPEIGNTGVNPEDEESRMLALRGFVVRDHVDYPSNWRSRESLQSYLVRHGVPGLSGIDTRSLVRRIRHEGAMNGLLVHGAADLDSLRERAAAIPSMVGRNLVDEVTCAEPYEWTEPATWGPGAPSNGGPRYRVVAYDYGIKRNILREMTRAGLDVTVVPASTPAAQALALDPDGIFLSNGPGDPDAVEYARAIVRDLVGTRPLFGICLGHQILGLALGGQTIKLKFGHHGGNQPGQDLATGKVAICAENHGYAVDADSLRNAGEPVEITHVNLNDGTVEGLAHAEKPLFSVQYHPEASPGPHDAGYFFGRFREMVARHKAGESVTGAAVASGRFASAT